MSATRTRAFAPAARSCEAATDCGTLAASTPPAPAAVFLRKLRRVVIGTSECANDSTPTGCADRWGTEHPNQTCHGIHGTHGIQERLPRRGRRRVDQRRASYSV